MYSEGILTPVFCPLPPFNQLLIYFIYLNSTVLHTQPVIAGCHSTERAAFKYNQRFSPSSIKEVKQQSKLLTPLDFVLELIILQVTLHSSYFKLRLVCLPPC